MLWPTCTTSGARLKCFTHGRSRIGDWSDTALEATRYEDRGKDPENSDQNSNRSQSWTRGTSVTSANDLFKAQHGMRRPLASNAVLMAKSGVELLSKDLYACGECTHTAGTSRTPARIQTRSLTKRTTLQAQNRALMPPQLDRAKDPFGKRTKDITMTAGFEPTRR